MSGHTLKGPNQKASIGKNLGIYRTTFDPDGKKTTTEISPEEAAEIKKQQGSNMQRRVAVGNTRANLSGADTAHEIETSNQEFFTYTDQDAINELNEEEKQGQGNGIGIGGRGLLSYDGLRDKAQQDIDYKKSVKSDNIQVAGPDQATTNNTYGQQNSDQSTAVVNREDFENTTDRFGKKSRIGGGGKNPNVTLHDVDNDRQERLSEEYLSKESGNVTGPSKKMKFGRKKK